jgi:hypothetical protein
MLFPGRPHALAARQIGALSERSLLHTHRVNYGKYLASKLNKYPVIVRLVLASGVATPKRGILRARFFRGYAYTKPHADQAGRGEARSANLLKDQQGNHPIREGAEEEEEEKE